VVRSIYFTRLNAGTRLGPSERMSNHLEGDRPMARKANKSKSSAAPKHGRGRPPKVFTPPGDITPPSSVKPLLVSRKNASVMLGGVDASTLRRLEEMGALKPLRLNPRSPVGAVYYAYDNVVAVAKGAAYD
jgi:hypothetical protein